MKYFLIETDRNNHIPYSVNRNRVIDIRYANQKDAHRIPNCCVMDMQVPDEVFFPDIIASPIVLVGQDLAAAVEMYAPGTVFKTIYLLHYESGVSRTYFMPVLREVECLSEKTVKSYGGADLLQIVLRKKEVENEAIFRIAGYFHPYIIGRMDFVESIMRRGTKGIVLKELEIDIAD